MKTIGRSLTQQTYRTSHLNSAQIRVVVSWGLIAIALGASPSAIAVPGEIHPTVQAVVKHLVGTMDTTAQAAANPKAPSVRMTTCPVAIAESPQDTYLYQEQALTKDLDHPYRQRLLKLYYDPSTAKIASESYKLVNATAWIGLCQKPKTQRQLTLGDRDQSVCIVWLAPVPDGFWGETPPQGCPAQIRGAIAITNTIHLMEAGMDTWDRGLDAQGNQVWGAKDSAYQYRWLKAGEN